MQRRRMKHVRPRVWLYRIAAILLGLAPFLFCELVLRCIGWSASSSNDDPLISFSAVRPLFVVNAAADKYEIDASRLGYFRPASFPVQKVDDEYRIFCLGGSTVQGNPWGPETAFTTWLELSLRAACPHREWRVINVGGISYASYRLRPILRELLNYQPDMFIFYTGHNEFLEHRTYHNVRTLPRWALQGFAILARLRVFQFVREHLALSSLKSDQPIVLPEEVDARLDYQGGLSDYQRDDGWRAATVQHYAVNLRAMIREAQEAEVAVIVCNPASNLRDCPPFKSEFRTDLSANETQTLKGLHEELRTQDALSNSERVQRLEKLLAIDERHAASLYELGKLTQQQGDLQLARDLFTRAKDEDICPLRMLSCMNTLLLEAVHELDVPLLDVVELMSAANSDGLPGEDLFVDHVHPTIRGHQMIAEALLVRVCQLASVDFVEGWKQHQQELFRTHLESLGAPYYARGIEHLEGLRRWTQGRAPKIGKPERPNP